MPAFKKISVSFDVIVREDENNLVDDLYDALGDAYNIQNVESDVKGLTKRELAHDPDIVQDLLDNLLDEEVDAFRLKAGDQFVLYDTDGDLVWEKDEALVVKTVDFSEDETVVMITDTTGKVHRTMPDCVEIVG